MRPETVTFNNPVQISQYIYDRALEPGMTPAQKVMLAAYAAERAAELWEEHVSDV